MRMNPKELAIGAWVLSDNELARIISLERRDNKLYVEAHVYDGTCEENMDEIALLPEGIMPLPVTEELLKKNGWKRCKCSANCFVHPKLGEKNMIQFTKNGAIIHEVKVKYVHQVQNVIRLFNTDLSIELQLFKI